MLFDLIVIGAGQSGLSMGYWLKQTCKKFIILDKCSSIGESWKNRYDSLILFTPKKYSSLPGLNFPGAPNDLPTKDEVTAYLREYAETFKLPVQLETKITSLSGSREENLFTVTTNQKTYQAKQIVIATGPFQTPFIPPFAHNLPSDVTQIHSSEYKNPSQLKPGPVLVVGGGNSGAQIAVELATKHQVSLSVGQKIRYLPLKFMGKPIFWWFDKLGILRTDRESVMGKKIRSSGDPIFGLELKKLVNQKQIRIFPRTKGQDLGEIIFENNDRLKPSNIIWATGFKPTYGWIDIPDILDRHGKPIHNRGVTNIPGVVFLGQPWQNKRGSALLLGVGEDAKYLAEHLASSIEKNELSIKKNVM
ncbi:flavin-containing monooxygenase [Peribacillus sp. SCS-155]|uniref:flavin-containing monooxygenase n=1 Tax=Peribacillus sedimenti TaxID=3115297 RepID=UPI003905FA4F